MWMSARLGGAFTPALVFLCLQYVTWRMAFLLFGVLGVVWAVIFFWWYRDDPRAVKQVNAAEAALLPVEADAGNHFKAPWKLLFTSRTAWCLYGQYFACSYSFYFFITWFPTYLLEARHFDVGRGSLLAACPCSWAPAARSSPAGSPRFSAGGPEGCAVRRGLGASAPSAPPAS